MSTHTVTEHGRTAASPTRRRAATVVAGVAVGTLGWAIAGPVAGIGLTVAPGSSAPSEVGAGSVVAASLVAGLAAWALLAVLERFMPKARARTIWTTTALIVLAVSLLGPLTAASAGAAVALSCLHLLVGGTLVVGMRRS